MQETQMINIGKQEKTTVRLSNGCLWEFTAFVSMTWQTSVNTGNEYRIEGGNRMSYTEWKNGWISDDEYAMEFALDEWRAEVMRCKSRLVDDEEEDEEMEDYEDE